MSIELQKSRLGLILVEQDLITDAQLDVALAIQKENGTPLGKILIGQEIISEEALARALAFQKDLEVVDLDEYEIEASAAVLLSAEVARRHKLIPIRVRSERLIVAIANPLDIYAIDTVQLATGMRVELVVATESAIEEAITHYLDGSTHLHETMLEAAGSSLLAGPVVQVDDGTDTDDSVPVVKLANEILTQAFKMRASDVHIENEEKEVRVRFRIDGVLRDEMTIPISLRALLVSRLKIMSEMDIAERRQPQDGRVVINVDGQRVQLRVASLPTMDGEDIVIRLLSSSSEQISLETLGLDDDVQKAYRAAFNRSYGAIMNTGPTGSGKTTTLYATLMELNTRAAKIITLEDPVEFSLPGISQMQVNRRAGLDFATGLRAMVRSDPDIIMVGEIRDLETARMAVRAAMTGHLVLSSLHTNDAPSAITRLVDMGVDPYLVTSSLRGVLAQRLARLLCPSCKREVEYDRDALELMGVTTEKDKEVFFEPGQCRKCGDSGYKGRLGIFEFLAVSQEINRLCVARASSTEIKELAINEGMRTLYEDGIAKARRGLLSLEEVRRIVL